MNCGRSSFFAFSLVVVLASTPSFAANPRAQEMLQALRAAAEQGHFAEFHRVLVETRAELIKLSPADRNMASPALAIFEDLDAIWTYSVTNPIGSFFNDDTLTGLFTALVNRYPAYLEAITPHAVTADDGQRFYPTTETRHFLIAQAVGAIDQVAAPPQRRQVPALPQTAVTAAPVAPAPPDTPPGPPVAAKPVEESVPAPTPGVSLPSPLRRPVTSGRLDIGAATRTFDAPLFGSTTTEFRIAGNQLLQNGANITVAFYGGFPTYANAGTVQIDRLPFRGGLTRLDAGDFLLEPLQLKLGVVRFSQSYILEGVGTQWRRDNVQWGLFAGRSKYSLQTERLTVDRFSLFGAEYGRTYQRNAFAVRTTIIVDPPFLSGADDDWDAVTTGTYVRELSPWAHLFSEIHTNTRGAVGGKVGSAVRFFRGELAAAVYTFGEEFPLVYPLYRPGEDGIELNGSYRPSEFTFVYGHANYVASESALDQSDLRGAVGFLKSFGSNMPTVDVSYWHDEVTHGLTSDASETFIADRARLGVAFASGVQTFSVVLEQLLNAPNVQPDRMQLTGFVRRVVAENSILQSSVVVQQEDSDLWGATAEGVLERPLFGAYSYLAGLGGAYVRRHQAQTGEGVVRLGITRRVPREGWYFSIESRLPFSIGLSKSRLNQSSVAIDIGNRYDWKDLSELRNTFAPLLMPESFGSIEGSVTTEGKGVSGVTVRLNGNPVAVTGADGSYRVSRVPIGPVVLSIDTRQLEPGYALAGGFTRELTVPPRGVARADFMISRFSSLQGALVRCQGQNLIPVAGARIALVSPALAITLESSSVGGFHADEIPPDTYDVVIDPSSILPAVPSEQIPRLQLDLTSDLLGYLIRIGCESR